MIEALFIVIFGMFIWILKAPYSSHDERDLR